MGYTVKQLKALYGKKHLTLAEIQEERKKAIEFHLNNENDYCGGKARAFEISTAREKSFKISVAEQNQHDTFIKMLINNKIAYVGAECKTNGGRIGGFFDGSIKSKFVIYRLEYTQKLKFENDVRIIPPVVIPTQLFLFLLEDVNAIKTVNKNGVQVDFGIQVSSKKLYNRLLNYVNNYADIVLFDNEKTYNADDFQNLTI